MGESSHIQHASSALEIETTSSGGSTPLQLPAFDDQTPDKDSSGTSSTASSPPLSFGLDDPDSPSEEDKRDLPHLARPPRIAPWLVGEKRGVVIILLGMMATSPDVLFYRVMFRIVHDATTIIFWQLMLTSLLLWAWVSLEAKHEANWRSLSDNLTQDLKWMGAIGLACGAFNVGVMALLTLDLGDAFPLIFVHPILSATLGTFVLGDILPRRTALSILFSSLILGVVLAHPDIALTVAGAALALASGVCIAIFLLLVRESFKRSKNLNIPAAVAVVHFALGVAVFATATTFAGRSVTFFYRPRVTFLATALATSIVNTIVVIALSWAPKYITSAHVGLVTLLVKGAIWLLCFLIIPERSIFIVAGVMLIFLVLATHETTSAYYRDVREAVVDVLPDNIDYSEPAVVNAI